MHDNRPMLLKHIDRILDERVRPARTEVVAALDVEAWAVTDTTGPVAGVEGAGEPVPVTTALAPSTPYRPFAVPGAWGPAWGTTWFRLGVDVPAGLRQDHLELDIDLGWADHSPGFQCEGSVRTPDGTVLKAVNPRNRWVPVREEDLDSSGRLTVYLEGASNPLMLDVHPFLPTDEGSRATQSHEPIYTFRTANLVRVHDEVRQLAADLDTLLGLARTMPEDSPRAWKVLIGTSDAVDQLDLADVPGTAAHVRSLLAPLLAVPAGPDAITLGAIGHAHIDSAWLWPVRETRRKAARTLSNVIRLLDDGSPMVFALPAAQHVAWIQEDDPALFARVKEYVAAGRIVAVGGSWVEPDAVLPSGESLARQLTEGTSFFRDELGTTCHEIWLPDSFGYTGSLPQIAHLAGYDSFLTQKISWNQVDVFPHHTLWWEGIDGTRIFTHFPPADTYGAEVSAEQLAHAERNFKDKGRASTEMFLYGYGDGGGGPVREMLERIERAQDLSGAPKIEHMSSQDFFTRARQEYPDAPVWVGELYLEKHRGTLTSQARTKRGNREAEAALREAETWCTTAWVRGLLQDDAYPAALLHELWRTTLLCQFHDILPGSSIAWVYEDAEVAQAQVIATARALAAQARAALADGVPATPLTEPLPQAPRGELPQAPEPVRQAARAESGTRLVFNTAPVARRVGGTQVPALGAAVVPADQQTRVQARAERTAEGGVLELGGTRVTLDATGAVTSLLLTDADGATQEVVPPAQYLGVLQLANDFPNEWDAWDLDPFYRSSVQDLPGTLSEVAVVDGAAQAVVDVVFGTSSARMTWRLDPDSEALAVTVEVSWHETEKVLKLAFPVDVHTDEATYGAQFGHLRRPTHENTSWDAYRFEVCAHKWLQVGESGRGLGIVNDATYGWDVTRHARQGGATWSLVRATLLRSARYPDPAQDQGEQAFRFALLPAACAAPARDEAYRLDLPARELPVGADVVAVAPLVEVTGAVIESLHAADDASGDVLVRLYEADGRRSRVTLHAPELRDATGTDLHGTPSSELGVQVTPVDGQDATWAFDLHPFGIATVRLRSERSH
ncbi:alpha-mannosidase [Actinomyces faecalis]|uniref:alpha-mannosidase n=1 Tax=Actinomyces faecalis TaxID=2722820 RepID=UPI001557E1C2|nr:alpha-mannosidase [Actinomyces faecalis]